MSITILEKAHNRENFECEVESLTNYIKTQASQDIKRNLAVCFVETDDDNNVIGYYTLTSESLGRESIPEKFLKKVPDNYNAPVILLGRLARDINLKGTGIGEYLLLNALERALHISNTSLGAMAVVVDPINEKARQFYEKYGFINLPDSERMLLPMNVIQKTFNNTQR